MPPAITVINARILNAIKLFKSATRISSPNASVLDRFKQNSTTDWCSEISLYIFESFIMPFRYKSNRYVLIIDVTAITPFKMIMLTVEMFITKYIAAITGKIEQVINSHARLPGLVNFFTNINVEIDSTAKILVSAPRLKFEPVSNIIQTLIILVVNDIVQYKKPII